MGYIVILLLAAGCNEPIPSSEIKAAKQAIAVAEAAKAFSYDPDNFQAARDRYKKALKMVVEDENAAARSLAIDAKKKADEATQNSRRKLALDTIAEAQKLLKKAERMRAGFLAGSSFQQAKTKLDDARLALSENKRAQAYTDAENCKEAAGRAIDESRKKIAVLKAAHSDAALALKRAAASEVVKKFASRELKEVQQGYQKAQDDKKKVDEPATITAGNEAMRNNLARDAYDRSLKGARNTVEGVGRVFRLAIQREREHYRKLADKKLLEAKNLLKELEKLKKQGLIKRLALPQPEPVERLTAGTSADTTTPKSDKERYEAALQALKRAETTFQSQSYRTSIKSSEEAIRLAKLIKKLMKVVYKYYIVQYRPTARDCLWRIASFKKFFGDPAMWPKIWKANKHLIVDPDLIYPGQKFAIPPE